MNQFIGLALAALTYGILPDSCLETTGIDRQVLAEQIVGLFNDVEGKESKE